jgi:site-specific recombinase XerD
MVRADGMAASSPEEPCGGAPDAGGYIAQVIDQQPQMSNELLSVLLAELAQEGDQRLNVVEGKGGDQRIVGVEEGALLYLERWINRRRELGLPPKGRVFVQFDGSGMNDSSVRQLFARAGKRAGMDKRVHPHGLRHSHAALMAWSGTPVHVIQRQLGHKSLDTTARYIGQVAPRQLVEAVNQIQPGARGLIAGGAGKGSQSFSRWRGTGRYSR